MAPPNGLHDPVTATEAVRAFQHLWKLGGGRRNFMRLGFAISGGVDSMALAYLWSRIALNRPGYNPYIRGFVVDHGRRPGSAEEAKLVASRLESLLGRPGQVITLKWPDHESVTKTNFETTARRLRFQALGKAAYDYGLQCVVLGHHADDAVESTLFRIASQTRGRGITGQKHLDDIPECQGQFGISKSGAFTRLQTQQDLKHYVGGPEEGGIMIARPLTAFPKSRLIATCKKAGLEWVEDESNQDLTLTPRNVIRNMLQTDVLPQALRQASIAQLLTKTEANRVALDELTHKLHEATYIRSLDLRSGVMEVYLPHQTFFQSLIEETNDRELVFQSFVDLWRHLISSVSPQETVVRTQTLAFAQQLFEMLLDGNHNLDKMCNPGTPTVVNLLKPLMVNKVPSGHLGLELSRAAFISSNKDTTDKPVSIDLPSIAGQSIESSTKTMKSQDFQLWDGRFWICARNFSPVPLRLVSLDKEMLSGFRKMSQGIPPKIMDDLFKEAAPGNSRWTIPAIVRDGRPLRESRILHTPYAPTQTPAPTQYNPSFEIYKYSTFIPDTEIRREQLPPFPGRQTTIPLHAVNPHLFPPEDNLSRRPQSERRLVQLPEILEGKFVSAAKYIVDKSFVVAIPTLGLFLNNYWAKRLMYDIRYKKIPLEDMRHVSRYRLERLITTPSDPLHAKLPSFTGERVMEASNHTELAMDEIGATLNNDDSVLDEGP